MLRATALLTILLALGAPALAQTGSAQGRVEALRAAEDRLGEARTSIAQRRALAGAIRAYEAAMQSLRRDIGRVAAKARARSRALTEQEAELRRLTGSIARLGRVAAPLVLTGAQDPRDGARALMLMEDAAANVRERAEALRNERAALSNLQAQQQALLSDLEDSRDRLAEVRDRLIERVEEDRVSTGPLPDLGEDAANLAMLAVALETTLPADPDTVPDDLGPYATPVDGPLTREFGKADPAGLERPGIAIATTPGALVTAPAESTVRFTGRLDGYGEVVILEPQEDVLMVMAGLGTYLVRSGEVVEPGGVLGFMPGLDDEGSNDEGLDSSASSHEELSAQGGEAGGNAVTKTLYMEVRVNQSPVDPLPWFEALR